MLISAKFERIDFFTVGFSLKKDVGILIILASQAKGQLKKCPHINILLILVAELLEESAQDYLLG